MRKTLFIAILFLTLSMGITIGVYAQANVQEIKAFLNHDIKFQLNGKTWTPTASGGSTLSPIIYEGSSYLPVRAIAEATGLLVDWNEATQTIIMQKSDSGTSAGTPTTKPAEPVAEVSGKFLSDLVFDKKEGDAYAFLSINKWEKFAWSTKTNDPFRIKGVVYSKGLGVHLNQSGPPSERESGGSVTYKLKSGYKRLTGLAGVDDSMKASKAKGKITIFGDGKTLFTSGELLGGEPPVNMDLDISNVDSLVIQFQSNRNDNLNLVIADAKLN